MRSSIFAFSVLLAASLAACGGSDDGTTIMDAPVDVPPDMAVPLTGLGQKCGQGMPACPTSAPACLITMQGATSGFCSAQCLTGASGMTNASGQFTSLTPAPDNAPCSAAFSGNVGTATCALVTALTPMETPKPNKSYTGVAMACAITCGASNACPFSTTCNTALGGLCVPN